MKDEEIYELSAQSVTVEFVDRATGKTYRRELPID